MLGGSSSTNATLYMRGTRSDYDAWNVPGWGSKEALHGFIKCEDNSNGVLLAESSDTPLTCSRPSWDTTLE